MCIKHSKGEFNFMKKIFVALLSLLTILTLAACEGGTDSNADSNITDNSNGEAQADMKETESESQSIPKESSLGHLGWVVLTDEERSMALRQVGDHDSVGSALVTMLMMSVQKVNFGGAEHQDSPPNTPIPDSFRVEMTRGNIAFLSMQFDNPKIESENQSIYQDILYRWYNEDFDSIVEDVQDVINLAYEEIGIIFIEPQDSDFFVRKTAEEEEAYVQRHFRS